MNELTELWVTLIVALTVVLAGLIVISNDNETGSMARADVTVSVIDSLRQSAAERSSEADSWSMYGGDAVNSFNYPYEAPDASSILWDVPFNADFSASPAVVDGRIYLGGSDYRLYCVDVNTGDIIFTHTFPSNLVSTPCIAGNTLYIGCRDDKMYAFDLSLQNVAWSFPTGGDVDSSPKVVNDTVYFGSLDGYVYAVNTDTHNLTWKYSAGENFMIKSSPAISGDRLVLGSYRLGNTGGKIICLDTDGFSDGNDGFAGEGDTNETDGDVIWEHDLSEGVKGSISIMDGKVFSGCYDRKIYCRDLGDGSLVWEASTGNTIDACPTPVPETNSVIIGSWDSFLYNLNASTGTTIWKAQVTGYVSAAAVVAEGRVYIGDMDYNLYCFDLYGNGDLTTDTVWGPLSMGSHQRCRAGPVIHNGILYQACENGDVLHSGKVVAVGGPELKVYDIGIDDTNPYEGEMVNIEAVVRNHGKVDCSMDVEIHYASLNNQIKELVGMERIGSKAQSYTSFNVSWRALEGVWKIWVGIKNTAPEDRTTDFHLNYFPGDFVVSPKPAREWNTYLGDGEHSAWSAVPVDTNRLVWRIGVPGILYQPVIAEGAVVVANTAGSVYAYDSVDNVERWHRDLGSGILSTPTILGGKVFVPMEGFKLTCLKIAPDGGTNWTFTDPAITDPITPVMAAHGMVFIATEGGRILALDEDDGRSLWDITPGGSLSTVPVIFGDTLAIVDDTGDLFRIDIFEGSIISSKNLGAQYPFTPTYNNGGMDVAFKDGKILRYHTVTNSTTEIADLEVTLSTGVQSVSEGGARVLGTSNGLQILDTRNTPMALYSTGGSISTRPSGAPDRCYLIDGNGLLCCINTSSGAALPDRMMWNLSLGAGAQGTPAVWEGKVYASGADGYIYCLGAPNTPPVALIAAPDSGGEFLEVDEVEFSAVGSSDPDRDKLIYRWTSSLDGKLFEGSSPSFSSLMSPGSHEISLEVDDLKGGKDRKTIAIYVHGKKILRESFPAQSVEVTAEVIGQGQIESGWAADVLPVENDTRWKTVKVSCDHPWVGWMSVRFGLGAGSKVLPERAILDSLGVYVLGDDMTNWTRLQGANLSVPGRYISVNLTGNHSFILSIYGEVEVEVVDVESPVAAAGSDREIIVGSVVIFDGTGSTDNVAPTNYTWTFEHGGPQTFYGKESSFRFDRVGSYDIFLNVSDAAGNWDLDSFNLTVKNEETNDPKSENPTWLWIVILIVVILVVGFLIVREVKNRSEQKKMDGDFFRGATGERRGATGEWGGATGGKKEEPDDDDVDSYVDLFSVGGKGRGRQEKKKKTDDPKDPPGKTVGGFKVKKIDRKQE